MNLYEELIKNGKSDIYPFHMPGHKRRKMDFPNPYDIDITEIDGFDNLHHATGLIKNAQDKAAKIYGANKSYFLINGSTCGLLAAISGAFNKGDKVLAARNCHKAVYHGIFLRELKPVYLYPKITPYGIQGKIETESVEQALEENPDVKGIIITSPTYDGVVSDVKAIADIAHQKGIPVIVDEAHGAHFGFSNRLPMNATQCGGDAVIVSVHKTLPAFTQTALLHICSDRIDKSRIEKFLGIYETSSPSYILMSGIEKCIDIMESDGGKLIGELCDNLEEFYDKMETLSKLRVVRRKDFNKDDAFDFDETKILIFTDDLIIDKGTVNERLLDGKILSDILLEEYHIQVEMVALNYVLALCSLMDTKEGFLRLGKALKEIDKRCTNSAWNTTKRSSTIYTSNEKKMEISKAWECESVMIPFSEAKNKVAADFISLYPPGIPIVVPGEVITEEIIHNIIYAMEMNIEVNGISADDNNIKVKVVKDR